VTAEVDGRPIDLALDKAGGRGVATGDLSSVRATRYVIAIIAFHMWGRADSTYWRVGFPKEGNSFLEV